MEAWIAQNWFEVLSSVGIIGSLLFDAFSRRSETKTQRIANLLTITEHNGELWKEQSERAELARILEKAPKLQKHGITPVEENFVIRVILHLNSVFYASKDGLLIKFEGLRKDASEFFLLPIPQVIWERIKNLQNDDFIAFVEDCRRGGQPF